MNSRQSSNSNYLNESLQGAYFGAITTLACHPCDRIKTHMQANTNLSSTSVILKIYQNNGLRSFYRGLAPNMVRASIKQIYRWPLQSTLPSFYSNIFGDSSKELLTGLTIGAGESFIIAFLEFIKIRLMLSSDKNLMLFQLLNMRPSKIPYADRINKHDFLKSLNPVFWKQITSWCTFLWTNTKLTNIAYEQAGTHQLPPSYLFITSLLTGGINTLLTMPIDAVKTRVQKPQPEKLSGGIFGTFKKIKEIKTKEGTKALYAGSRWRLFEYMIHASIYTKFKESRRQDNYREPKSKI